MRQAVSLVFFRQTAKGVKNRPGTGERECERL